MLPYTAEFRLFAQIYSEMPKGIGPSGEKECVFYIHQVTLHIGRLANSDRTIMGHKIPAGSAVMAPTWFIHHDPDLWPDPWKFEPERFAPENK